MAYFNRVEVSTAIQALAAVLGETEHKESLDDNFAQSVVFRKDVSDTDTAAGATKTLDFIVDDKAVDYIEVTQTNAAVSYTLADIQQGEIKFLKITKTAGQTIAFANGTDVSIRKDYIDETLTSVIYRITNKDASIYIESISVDNDKGTDLKSEIIDIGDWNLNTSVAGTANPAAGNPAHGIANGMSKIRHIEVAIIADGTTIVNDGKSPDSSGAQGIQVSWTDTVIGLVTFAGNKFDSALYDATSFNRGWATVYYLP